MAGLLVMLVLVVAHELGHALLHHLDGYEGRWEILVGPSALEHGSIGVYRYFDEGPPIDHHHRVLNPLTMLLFALLFGPYWRVLKRAAARARLA